jgi:hypothetical protein
MPETTQQLSPAELQKKFQDLRTNQLRQWGVLNNDLLLKTIPEIAGKLILSEFNFEFTELSDLPIVFVVTWKHIMDFVRSQNTDQFSLDVAGVSVEYVTEYTETEKNSNIVPQLIHKKIPIFHDKNHNSTTGSSYKTELMNNYNAWRTENLVETITKIENDVFAELLQTYAIDIMYPPICHAAIAAMYAAGVQLALETKEEINMYNIFSIESFNGDKIVLSPAAIMKQIMKCDEKKY